ncbi:unnamed protein product [Paramecium primaurelia]|uniref:PCI domain-containing protein n=1 Tax=Paramecium primaurelia TaxID=5886 RepID=A0A8S1NVI7_PARPR|nr:unnamed protein product [Paramecium primaurelia]
MNILNQHQNAFPHLLTIIDSMRVYQESRLWKQLSDQLLVYIKDPQVNQGTHLKDLFEGFVKKFYQEIDEMKLVRILIKTAEQYGDFQSRIDFLKQFKLDEQPQLVIDILIAFFKLQQGQLQEVDELLKQYKQKSEKLQEVDPLVYSMLYYLAYNFYKIKNIYEEFYVNALQYLAYTNDQDMLQEQKVQLSYEMALAVLISPNIYNFSELLQQPVLVSLKESAQYNWVYQLLDIFNRGSVRELNSFQWNEERKGCFPNFQVLNEKIRIMAFLELAFSLPKNNRVCTFEELAQVSELPLNDIERLVMRTISKGLVKGRINQVKQTITISYVVPRVLTMDKIDIINKKFGNWEKSLNIFLKEVEDVRKTFN